MILFLNEAKSMQAVLPFGVYVLNLFILRGKAAS
jgi:hypothetical protein